MEKLKTLVVIVFVVFFFQACTSNENDGGLSEKIIRFDTETIPVNSGLAKFLGYDKITVKEGNYKVSFGESNFGKVIMNLEDFERRRIFTPKTKSAQSISIIRVRIASKKKNCKGGIGFRCGFVRLFPKEPNIDIDLPPEQHEWPLPPELKDREKLAEVVVDEETKKMSLSFLEPVDWEKLENE